MVTDEQLIKAVADNITIARVIRDIGMAVVGTSYDFIHKKVYELGLNTDHWRGCAHGTTLQHRKFGPECLNKDSNIPTGTIKKIIIRERLIPYVCEICNTGPIWNGRELVLRLDHKNGIRNDHLIDNLRFLCPNCDSQTETFCGRNKSNRSNTCLCGNTCSKRTRSGKCIKCAAKSRVYSEQ